MEGKRVGKEKDGKGREQVFIFDTTLRDGEQSPGATMDLGEKIQIARALARLKVDIIEAGFPVTSPGDHDAVKAIGQEVEGPVVCGLARCVEKDIKAAASALRGARRGRIHVFLATSEIHRKYQLNKAKDEIIHLSVEGVKQALSFCPDVEFSPMDASRTEVEFLSEVVQAVIEAGAGTVNIPDTVGYALPDHFGGLIRTLMERVPNIGQAVISVHCHNDLGLAVANSLAAIQGGARQVECTINGIGERAGNAAMEEIVMALRTRHDFFPFYTAIDSKRLFPTSQLVANVTGIHVQRNKAVVGENAFAHESGVHQDGILKERTTYEIMRPQDVGVERSKLVLGKHSGKHALDARLKELGYHMDGAQVEAIFGHFKLLCDKKKTVYDADLIALVEDIGQADSPSWELDLLQVTSGNRGLPTATVVLKNKEGLKQDAAIGDGPIDALVNAIDRITGINGKILDFQVHALSEGREAQGEVSVRVDVEGRIVTGRGFSTDIIEASAKAYLNAICRASMQSNPRKGSGGAKGKKPETLQ